MTSALLNAPLRLQYYSVNLVIAILVNLPFCFGGIMAFPGTPVGALIHRRALSRANRPGDPYHHPSGVVNPQFASSFTGWTFREPLNLHKPHFSAARPP